MREVLKFAKRGKLVAVIVTPNIEPIEATGGLDDVLTQILDACRENGASAWNKRRRGRAGGGMRNWGGKLVWIPGVESGGKARGRLSSCSCYA